MKRHYNIGFLLTAEHSCYNAAFGLAHALQERGHNAVFLVNDESIFVQYVNLNGFKVIKMEPIAESQATKQHRRRRLRLWKRLTEHGPSVLLKQDRLAALIERNSLDLCFLDDVRDDVNLASVVLARMAVPTILLSYTFASGFQSGYPPVFSSMVPPANTKPRSGRQIANTLLWVWTICTKGRPFAYDGFDYVKQSFEKLLEQVREFGFERELRQLGWTSTWSEWKRRPRIPQIVLGHRTLDWPAIAANPGRCYFGTTDLLRKNSDFDWSIVESDRPIVYCSISTAGGFEKTRVSTSPGAAQTVDLSKKKFRMAKRYLEVILDCFSQRKDWQLIIACGPFYETLRNDVRAANIHMFERVPQLAVLEKVDLAITWGGPEPFGNA